MKKLLNKNQTKSAATLEVAEISFVSISILIHSFTTEINWPFIEFEEETYLLAMELH